MSKARRIKAQRQQARRWPPRGSQPLNSIADIEAAENVWTSSMPGRVTYLTDPVLGGGREAAGIGPGGELIPDESGTVEPIPVVLFEPAQVVMMRNKITGLMQETKTEAIVAQGFHRLPGGPVKVVRPAPGWEVRRRRGELVLCDGSGDVWACSKITPDPAWVSAAVSQRSVIVYYGPKLGVRTPPGMSPARYTTAKRAAEFRQSCREGLVAAATVTWRGEVADQTLEWITFLPGSLGQPMAGVFVPEADFTRNGGPEAFGLTRLGDHGLSVAADPIKTLLVRVRRTDIDLIDPAEAAGFNMVGGVHYSEGVNKPWLKAALGQKQVLVLTGRHLPLQAPDDPHACVDALEDLWGAIVPVQPHS